MNDNLPWKEDNKDRLTEENLDTLNWALKFMQRYEKKREDKRLEKTLKRLFNK